MLHLMKTKKTTGGSLRSFSLIEVLLALGIISFALVALIGLFTLGLKTNKESSDQIEAANVASLLLSTLRAIPTNPPAGFALPALNQGTVSKTVKVASDGTTTDLATTSRAYNLYYVVGTNATTGPKLANVYMMLWWPASAPMPTNNPSAYYEVTAQIALP